MALLYRVKNIIVISIAFIFVFNEGFGQIQKDTTALTEVVVYNALIPKSVQNSAYAVTQVSEREIESGDNTMLTAVLNKVPGLYMQQGALNTNRITIRGLGARSQFSTNRIKAYFENIPLTNAEGETVIEDIDVESIGSIEVIKGPNNSSFGAGLAGVIHLKAREAGSSYVKTAASLGSFGLWKQNLSLGLHNEVATLSLNYNHLKNDGFRDNSSYKRDAFSLFGNIQLNKKSTLSVMAIFTKLKAFIPSSLNENDFQQHPETAATNWAEARGFESYTKLLSGLNYAVNFSSKWALSTGVFGNYKDAYEPRPFDILDEETFSIGMRSKLNHKARFFSFPAEWSFGGELMVEDYTFFLLENLYQTQPGSGSVEGAVFAKINQKRNYFNLFLEQNTEINDKLFIETGLSFNNTNYSLKDNFEQTENPFRQRYGFENVFSPRVGGSYKLLPGKNIYVSISKGFSIPSVAETLTPEGQINTNLKPETGWNYETGLKANWLQNKLYTEVAVFSTQITNLLVARRVAEDQFVGVNAGESSHRGIEISTKYRWQITDKIQIYPYFTGSFNRFRFKEFIDNDEDFSGNKLTGSPNYQWNAGIDLQTDFGLHFFASVLNVGKIPLNDSNTGFTSPYTLTNLKALYKTELIKGFSTEFFIGINNLFDEKYASNILPNAVAFGNTQPRYYYPGNPRNFYVGFSLMYIYIN